MMGAGMGGCSVGRLDDVLCFLALKSRTFLALTPRGRHFLQRDWEPLPFRESD